MPTTFARMLRAFGNELVLLVKGASLVNIFSVHDVMDQARNLFAQTFDLSVFYIAAVNYLLIVLLSEALWRKLEGRNKWVR